LQSAVYERLLSRKVYSELGRNALETQGTKPVFPVVVPKPNSSLLDGKAHSFHL
jgi:hypothetical protein